MTPPPPTTRPSARVRLDTDFVRSWFPALDTDWALLENAGGSVPARPVVERVTEHLSRRCVQLEATYPLSAEATRAVEAGRVAAAELVGADPGEVVLGPSSTVLARRAARALRGLWREGDEVVVTNVDHETNIGAWRLLEETGIVVREWRFDPETLALRIEDLEPLLNERTRLVAFTNASNLVGTLHDARAIVERVHAAGALACVDGVATAPHRRIDVGAIGADLYFLSLYKVYGPHLGMLRMERSLLESVTSQNHFFIEDPGPHRLEPGGVVHELVASLPGIVEYLEAVDAHHFGADAAERPERLTRTFELFAEHEERLARPLLAFLADHPRVRVLGSTDPDRRTRVPTVSFTVDGLASREVPPLLEERRVAVRFGHNYAYRLVRELGLLEGGGVVRASMVHYNTEEEVERLVGALDDVLQRRAGAAPAPIRGPGV